MLPEAPAFLWDARQAASRAVSVAQGHTVEDYLGDWMLQSAAERQLEIIGEALNKLRAADTETAERIPDVHAIIATRNILVHAYAQVDHERVWRILTRDLPTLVPLLDELLAEAESA